ncbi:YbjN domain-containing protein [Micromonospora sp. WMMA1363]|uniref:YbjN domain-containing protein n=1 Tax=Micromonospora sp. WMMA1363 TaxID=3053985 RepID=UPI00259CECA1|nr:YbjN domain-containing protein [Micromonospora sp. WMMA1363]MDM4723126.1 YbjN domain-containing protein [Micromonospora sp. WMMA1363]
MTGQSGGRGLEEFGWPGWLPGRRRPGRDQRALAEELADARDSPDGEARDAELERIAAHADATGDDRAALGARLTLIETYLVHGQRWRLVEPVRRCLAATGRRPDLLPPGGRELLSRYQRYAVEALLGSPRVGLEQAQALLDDLAASSAAVTAELHCRIADHLGDEPAARSWFDRWTAAIPEPAGGCPDCATARRAELLAGWGDWRAALDMLAEPGSAGCTEAPGRALAAALLPWLRADEPTRAATAHVQAYRRHRRERAAFPFLAAHLRFCALGGHLTRGLDVLAEQLPRLDHADDELSAMEFATAGALVCAVATEAGLGGRAVHRPAHGPRPAADLDVEALGAVLLDLATGLAGSFDARNGTGHQSGRIASWLAERALAAPVPLPPGGEVDDHPADDHPADGADDDHPADGADDDGPDVPVPLSLALITTALDRRGDRYAVDAADTVVGRWGEALIQVRQAGERGEILHVRSVASRRLPAGRRSEAYAFCNSWNHDRLLPAAYVHDAGDELVLAGDVRTDLSHGVAPVQLDVLLEAAVRTGSAYADAVAALP